MGSLAGLKLLSPCLLLTAGARNDHQRFLEPGVPRGVQGCWEQRPVGDLHPGLWGWVAGGLEHGLCVLCAEDL